MERRFGRTMPLTDGKYSNVEMQKLRNSIGELGEVMTELENAIKHAETTCKEAEKQVREAVLHLQRANART